MHFYLLKQEVHPSGQYTHFHSVKSEYVPVGHCFTQDLEILSRDNDSEHVDTHF